MGEDNKKVTIPGFPLTSGSNHFSLTMHIRPGNKPESEIVVHEEYTVTTTADKGAWEQIIKFDAADVTMRGNKMNMLPTMPEVTVTRSVDGKYTATNSKASGEGMAELQGAIQLIHSLPALLNPGRPIGINGHWDFSFHNPNKMVGPDMLVGTARLEGKSAADTVEGWKISFKAKPGTHEDDAPQGSIVLNSQTGDLLKLDYAGKGMFAGGPATVRFEVRAAAKNSGVKP